MKKLVLIAIVLICFGNVNGQPKFNVEDVKYVIFTSDTLTDGSEGIYRYTDNVKSGCAKSPTILYAFKSKNRGIYGHASCFDNDIEKLSKRRKVNEKDKRVKIEKTDEILNSVELIDMDILFSKLSKDEFIKIWNDLVKRNVYFIDRSEIKNKKVKLYPVHIWGINLY